MNDGVDPEDGDRGNRIGGAAAKQAGEWGWGQVDKQVDGGGGGGGKQGGGGGGGRGLGGGGGGGGGGVERELQI